MTGNDIKLAAQKRVKDTTSNLNWDLFFAITIDKIFGWKVWKFATNELNYLHPQGISEYQFNATPIEKALQHIRSLRLTTTYTVLGSPIPAAGSAHELEYLTLQRFYELFPDNIATGEPQFYAIRVANDGTNGMQISLAPLPNTQSAVWVNGDFIPVYAIDAEPLPILPTQFHWIVIEGMAAMAAEELGKQDMQKTCEGRFAMGIGMLEQWDRRTPTLKPQLRKTPNRYPFSPAMLPSNFDWRDR